MTENKSIPITEVCEPKGTERSFTTVAEIKKHLEQYNDDEIVSIVCNLSIYRDEDKTCILDFEYRKGLIISNQFGKEDDPTGKIINTKLNNHIKSSECEPTK